ncbi:MAG: ArdC-like ssDNA-binding domain-containing protein [Peptostreptococcaceae bacterium]
MYNASQQDKVTELIKSLEEGVKDFFHTDKYKSYLNFMSKFHSYSFNNIMLILNQKPNASLIAGFKKWGEMERKVKKGEKGISILRPQKYSINREVDVLDQKTGKPVLDSSGKAIQEKKKVEGLSFKVAYVFDVSQTEGKEIPSIVDELKGSINNKEELFSAIKTVSKVPIVFKDIELGAKGYFNSSKGYIAIKNDMSDTQTIKTLIHELAHSRLHNKEDGKNKIRNVKEIEAESIAYIVSNSLGLDTSDYSFAYVASWSKGKDLSELKDTLKVIQVESDKLINEIKSELEKLRSIKIDEDKISDKTSILTKYSFKNKSSIEDKIKMIKSESKSKLDIQGEKIDNKILRGNCR